MIYKLIGMAVVKLSLKVVRRKASANKRLLAGAGVATTVVVVGTTAVVVGYLATRETPEA